MAQKSDIPGNFWRELKRRKVTHVITVYAAIAFAILQFIDIIVQPLQLPAWTLQFVIVLLCIGFVISLFVSWVYDITPSGVKKTKPLSAIRHIDQSMTKASGSWRIATYISGTIIIALVTFNFIHGRNLNTNLTKIEKSIAVLPFKNDSPSDSTTYFINGIMEEVLNNLQKINDFRVLSRTTTEQYKGEAMPAIPEIAKKLGVNYIVQGSGQKYGKNFRLSVQLIRANKESQLWAKSYKQEINNVNDIFNTQSEIAQSIATELETTISPEEKQLIEKVPTSSFTAYDFYQRGRDELPEFWIECDDFGALNRAEKYYRKALKFDPMFADAYVGLAEVYYVNHYWSDPPPGTYLDSVLILSDLALSYDDRLSEAYFVKGNYFQANGLKDDALKEFDKALKLNRNDWMAYYGKAKLYEHEDPVMFLDNLQKALLINHNDKDTPTIYRMIGGELLETGFFDNAKTCFARAFELDGDSSFYLSCLGGTERDQGNYKESIEYSKRALMNRPNYFEVTDRIANALYYSGQYSEALKYYKELKYLNPQVAFAYWQTGFRKEAEHLFSQIIKNCNSTIRNNRYKEDVTRAYYDLACSYAFNGDKDNAIKYFKFYSQVKNCELWWLTNIKNDPLLNSLRNKTEFRQFLMDLESKFQAEHERVRKWLEEQGMLKEGL
jgi:TolB-like protein/Tfp pilus assembly protein PilF